MLIQVLSCTEIIVLLSSHEYVIHECRHCYCHLPDDQMNANENESLVAGLFYYFHHEKKMQTGPGICIMTSYWQLFFLAFSLKKHYVSK